MGLIPFLEEERVGNERNRLNKSTENVTKTIIKTVTYVDTVRTKTRNKGDRIL